MYSSARIAAVLALASFLAAVPARALSLKDWEAKSNPDQIQYVSGCLARLVIAVGKTDQPLAQKITSYYGDKTPGAKYPQGMLDLFAQIGRLENQAKTDRSVDLSKIEIEDVILRTTAVKFGGSNAALNAGKEPARPAPAKPAVPAKPEIQTIAPPKQPQPAAPKVDTTSGGFGDLIGGGGFIKPPEMTPAVCVPPVLVDKLSWENPAPGSDMAAFKDSVTRYVIDNAVGRQEYLIRSTAFDDYVRLRRGAFLARLVELIPEGKECAKTMYLYRLRKSPGR